MVLREKMLKLYVIIQHLTTTSLKHLSKSLVRWFKNVIRVLGLVGDAVAKFSKWQSVGKFFFVKVLQMDWTTKT